MKPRPSVVASLVVAALGAVSAGPGVRAQSVSEVYDQNCAMCHQRAGEGVPGAFPHLAGRAGALAALPAGREMMISAALFGISGALQVDGQRLSGFMPSFGQLSDAQISDALNYVTHLDGRTPHPFTPVEVAAVRARPALTPAQVNALARDPALVKAAP